MTQDYTALVAELRQRARLQSSERFPPSTFVEGRAADAIASLEGRLAKLPSQALWDESRKALASMRNENGELSHRASTAEAERDRLAARCEGLERTLAEIHAVAMLAEGNATLSTVGRIARAALQEPQT